MTTTNSCVCVCVNNRPRQFYNQRAPLYRQAHTFRHTQRARACVHTRYYRHNAPPILSWFFLRDTARIPSDFVRANDTFRRKGGGGEGFFVVIFASINVDDLSRPNIRATRASLSAARSRHGNRSPLPLPIPLYVPTVRGGRKPPEWPRERTESAGRTRFSRHPKIIINSQPTPC